MNRTLQCGYAQIRDFKIHGVRSGGTSRLIVTGISIGDRLAVPSARFWRSLLFLYRVPRDVFRRFGPEAVFRHIQQSYADDRVRYCLERDSHGDARLLAVSDPRRQEVGCGEIDDLIARYDALDLDERRTAVTIVRVGRFATLEPSARLGTQRLPTDSRMQIWPAMSS
jgi:hypothetical protein